MQNVQIAERIKFICKSQKKTISKMLIDCNISKSLIYDMEKRNMSPSCDKLTRIADYLDCSVDYLLGRTNDYTKVTGSTTIQSPQPSELNEDEQDILQIYRSLSRRTKHEFMSMAYKMQNHDGLED